MSPTNGIARPTESRRRANRHDVEAMTNDEFLAWRKRHFASQFAAAKYLDLDRDTIDALETGAARKSRAAYPVKHHIALACLAIERGCVVIPPDYAADGYTAPSPGRSRSGQTQLILARADGKLTATEIAAALKVKRSAVYAALAAARRKGMEVRVKADPRAFTGPRNDKGPGHS